MDSTPFNLAFTASLALLGLIGSAVLTAVFLRLFGVTHTRKGPPFIKLVVTLLLADIVMYLIETVPFIATGSTSFAIKKMELFVGSQAVAIGSVATAVYALLTIWLIMETRWSRKTQLRIAREQEAAAKADSVALEKIALALDHVVAALNNAPPTPPTTEAVAPPKQGVWTRLWTWLHTL